MNDESLRLRNTIYEWQDKVGIKFDIEDFEQDFEIDEDDGESEF